MSGSIAERLRRLINGSGMSQADVSLLAGMSRQQLNEILSGKITPRVDTLQRIVEAVGGTMAEFFAADSPGARRDHDDSN